MKPRMTFGFVGVLLLALPSVLAAQRGAAGGVAGSGMRLGAVSSGSAPHAASVVRTSSSSVASAVPLASSAVRARASVHSTDVPSRHAGLSATVRTQNAGSRVFAPVGPPLSRRRNPPPVTGTTPRVVYILGVGGYYFAAPADESAGQPQDAADESAEVEGQQADEQQAGAANDRNGDRGDERSGERDGERPDNRDEGQTEASAAPPAPERHV